MHSHAETRWGGAGDVVEGGPGGDFQSLKGEEDLGGTMGGEEHWEEGQQSGPKANKRRHIA